MESKFDLCDRHTSLLNHSHAFTIERDVVAAFRQSRLHLAYQPIVSSTTGKYVAFEAFSRWKSPRYGLVSPTEIIMDIDDPCLTRDYIFSIVDELFAALCYLRGKNIVAPIHFNIRLDDITDDLVERLVTHSQSLEISLNQICLEISEKTDPFIGSALIARIANLRSYGVKFSLNNYGNDAATDKRLDKLPFSKIKIHQSYLEDLNEIVNGERVISKFLRWEREGYEVIFEGVEDFGVWEKIQALGNFDCQGFMIAYPMNRTYIASWNRRWSKLAAILCRNKTFKSSLAVG